MSVFVVPRTLEQSKEKRLDLNPFAYRRKMINIFSWFSLEQEEKSLDLPTVGRYLVINFTS
jgi:hypothetical protein